MNELEIVPIKYKHWITKEVDLGIERMRAKYGKFCTSYRSNGVLGKKILCSRYGVKYES